MELDAHGDAELFTFTASLCDLSIRKDQGTDPCVRGADLWKSGFDAPEYREREMKFRFSERTEPRVVRNV